MEIFSLSIIVVVLSLLLIAAFAIRAKALKTGSPFKSDAKLLNVSQDSKKQDELKPISVNYHLTRQCNYRCGFCFHTAKTSYVLPIDEAKKGLTLLKENGNSYVDLVMLYFAHKAGCPDIL
jgi:radical S-adenosyl methionine domain-containing protein 2